LDSAAQSWYQKVGAAWAVKANGGSLPSVGVSASGDTTGATDLAAIQAAHDALPAHGGSIQLSPSLFYLNAALVFTKQVTLRGWGGGLFGDAGTTPAVAMTTIYCTSATADGITVSVAGCSFKDFALVNTAVSTPTAGAGIHDTLDSNSSLDHVTILGFWNLLDVGGAFANVSNCWLYDAVNYYVYIHAPSSGYNDNCVTLFSNTTFSGWNRTYVAAAGIRYESGGGSKVTGCYLVGHTMPGNASAGHMLHGIDVAVADGITTGSLSVTGTTIAACTEGACIRIGQKGAGNTGQFTNVTVIGCEFGVSEYVLLYGAATSAARDKIRNLEFSGNTITNITGSGGAIQIYNCAGAHIGRNNWGGGVTAPLITLAASPDGAGGSAGEGTRGVLVDPQALGYEFATADIISDLRRPDNDQYAMSSGVVYDYLRNAYCTANGAWVSLFKLTVQSSSFWAVGGLIELDIDGYNGPTKQAVCIRQKRAYSNDASRVVTLQTVDTDVSFGAGAANVAVQYVLTAGVITIQVQTTDVTQTYLYGMARLRVNGQLATFHIGA